MCLTFSLPTFKHSLFIITSPLQWIDTSSSSGLYIYTTESPSPNSFHVITTHLAEKFHWLFNKKLLTTTTIHYVLKIVSSCFGRDHCVLGCENRTLVGDSAEEQIVFYSCPLAVLRLEIFIRHLYTLSFFFLFFFSDCLPFFK